MALAAFNFERGKLSGRVNLTVLDLETTILEIPSRFTSDSANVGRVMFRARLATGQTRGSVIVRLYNDAEDGQVIRQASIAVSSVCVIPITGGVTMPTVGGMRVTAELTSASVACEVDAFVDPSTGAIPSANPFSVVAAVGAGAQTEFGPAPMDCTNVQIQLADALIGNSQIIWLDSAGNPQIVSGIAAGSSPFINLIPAGGFHLAISNGTGAPEQALVNWS